MSAISLKSITGITSITTPAGVDNVFTVHTNDTTERFRVDQTGNLNIAGIVTVTKDLDVDGHTNLDNVSISGVTTMSGALNANGNIVITSATPHITFDDTNNRNWQLNADGGNFIIKDTTDSVNRFYINSAGNAFFSNDLDVDGHTNLDNTDIVGILTVTSTTQYGGFKLSNNSSIVGELVGLSGSNDTGALSLWSGGSKYIQLSAQGNSYITGGKVGIGTDNVQTLLHLKGTGGNTSGLRLDNSHDNVSAYFQDDNNNSDFLITYSGTGGAELTIHADGNLGLNEANGDDVLIGTASVIDNSKLTIVKAAAGFTTAIALGNGNGSGTGSKIISTKSLVLSADYDANNAVGMSYLGFETDGTEKLRITSSGDMGLSNTGTNDPNNYSGWCTLTLNGTNGSELDFERGGTLYGDILCNNTQFNLTTRESSVDINFATKNNAGSTANRLTINSEGNIQHKSGSGVSYFNGASEYVFGSTGSSPTSGGAEANVQIHAHKTRAQFSINAYMNNSGGPFMQMVSSRSGTVGTLGTVTLNNDTLGDIRFGADDGNGGVVYGAQIISRAKTQATTNGVAGRLEFRTAKDASSTTREIFSMNEGGALTAESESPALYGYLTSLNNGNHYVDFPQWTRDSFVCLEIFGNVNPNSAGSGAYSDPVHMYVYRGIGWTGSRMGYYIYSVSVAPPARHAFPSGTGYSGNAQISAVWTDGSSNLGNETATSTNYMRLLVPNANNTYNFTKSFRIFRRR